MTFKVGDRVITDDGVGEILSFQDGMFEVGIQGESDWFYEEHELRGISPALEKFAEAEAQFANDPISTEDAENLKKLGEQLGISSFEQSVRYHTNKIADLLIAKNKQYSNSALDPIRVFSKSDRQEQLRVRADDKLSRIRNGDTSEDAITDLCGYLILMKIAEASE